jgi:diguanylate cyclase
MQSQDALQWKQKYFDQLEESERRDKQWAQAEELLRRTISRLTLAADGLDPALDRQLRELRNAIRDRASTARLDGLLEDMSRALVKLDGQRKQQRQDAGEGSLLALLDALSLPRGTGRKSKALRKQLQSAGGEDPALLQAFADLIHSALELSAEAAPGVPQATAHPGLLKRLFGAGERKAPPTDPGQAEADGGGAVSAQVRHQTNDGIREVLIQLLERLSLPEAFVAKVQAIRDQIENTADGDSWDRVLERIADLVEAIRAQSQRQRHGIENFLRQLTGQLQEVDRQLQDSGQFYAASRQAGEQLDSAVKREITGISDSVRDATDIAELKQVVQTHIESVVAQLDRHRDSEQRRYQQASAEVEAMSARLSEMEAEAEALRSRVNEERNQALTDALTGIPNRLAYEERLEQEVARWKRFGTPLVLVVWDIDHFKKVNDRFGHKAGDKVLRTLARVLADNIRETDFVARYGGEEFAMLMTGSELDVCLHVVEKLRAAVEATGFHFRDEAVTITASCGLAAMRDGDSTEQWFERADQALYRAKQEGRNRCELAG